MAIIRDEDQAYLREFFQDNLETDVTLRLYTGAVDGQNEPCLTCDDTRQLLQELVDLSDRLRLDVLALERDSDDPSAAGIESFPTIVYSGRNRGVVRFVGVPAGYEFGSLVQDLVDVSRGTTELEYHSREALGRLTKPVHIKVFVTPT